MKVSPEVLQILSEGVTCSGKELTIQQTLDRKQYVALNAVLEAIGGKWNKKAKAHIFGSDALELVEDVLLTGEITSLKKDLAFFPTPKELAVKLVDLAEVRDGCVVLEPSAGSGRLVDAALAKGPRVVVFACERDPEMRAKLLLERSGCWLLESDDFMDCVPEPMDRVVMNPPFKKVGKGDHLDHVRHAALWLKPKGVLAAILPSSVSFRQDKRHKLFREWILGSDDLFHEGEIISLPADSFKESGTGVNVVVVVKKRK